jgi:X-X-X-Leu-X-X-Gly heptad repeat protein
VCLVQAVRDRFSIDDPVPKACKAGEWQRELLIWLVAEGLPTLAEGLPTLAEGLPTLAEGLPTLAEGLPTLGHGRHARPHGHLPRRPRPGTALSLCLTTTTIRPLFDCCDRF